MNIDKKVADTKQQIISNSPTTFSDIVHVATRSDDMVFLQFLSDTPNALVENFRTMMQKGQLKKLIDIVSKSIDYYPIKATSTKAKVPNTIKKIKSS